MEPMPDFEKLGLFYLGKTYDFKHRKVTFRLASLRVEASHDPCCLRRDDGQRQDGAWESVCSKRRPSTVSRSLRSIPREILGIFCWVFPSCVPKTFFPGLMLMRRAGRGQTVEQFAAKTAEQWKEGLAAWGEDGARIARLKNAVDLAIYTPGSSAGLPLTVFRSFDAATGSSLRARLKPIANELRRPSRVFWRSWESRRIRSRAESISCFRTCWIKRGAGAGP